MTENTFTPAERDRIMGRMRVPILSFVALLVLLAVNVVLATTVTLPHLWVIEALVLVTMVAIVLLYSMEVLHEPPLIRLYSTVGFCWVAILFAMTLIDYTTR